ncbi:gas vesicle protein [Lactobacillus colini]|uniref:Gas vesicle protein n=1 Tax=Lactobacillus colini TaxID=1819254 RepID=A0ABS4MGD2_9LACO|nr:hypothetical protein [Lactobacillus colini]MBP2058752.1 gas vesicle protein [Lactobacillus colini]
MIKFKPFVIGLGLGGLLGTVVSFMTDQKTGQPINKEVKDLVDSTSSDIKDISTNTQKAQKQLALLKEKNIPQAKKNIQSIQRSIKEFQYNIQPNLKNIQASLDKLNSESKNLK